MTPIFHNIKLNISYLFFLEFFKLAYITKGEMISLDYCMCPYLPHIKSPTLAEKLSLSVSFSGTLFIRLLCQNPNSS